MNLFRIMQSIRGWAQAGKIDFPGAVKYLTDLGVKMDGIVHQALKNVFKEGKARDPDFGNVVKDFPIDDAGIPFNPNTLKSTAEKRGVENLFKEKSIADKMSDIKTTSSELDDAMKEYENIYKPKKEPKYGKLNYDKIAKLEGVDVEEIRGKSFREIIEYLAMIQKADGGRVGFKKGGWDPGAGRDERGYQSGHPSHGGGDKWTPGAGKPQHIPKTKTDDKGSKLEIGPVVKTKRTDLLSNLIGPYPTDVGLGALSKYGYLDATVGIEDLLAGEINPTITADTAFGPVNVKGTYSDDEQTLGAHFNKGPFSANITYNAITGEPEYWAGYSETFKDGGRIGFVDGGWADDLTGPGLALYNSMTAGGHSDQAIQDTLTELGYWTPDGEATETVESIVGTDITQGGDNDPASGDNDGAIRLPPRKKTPTTDFNINPAAQLTGKGRIDPMGSTYDNLAMMGPMDYKTAGYHRSEIPGQEGYVQPDTYFEPPTGILQKAKRNVLDPIVTAAGAAFGVPLGLLTAGAELIGGMLPYNERAAMENQMLESGFALDDIGRIVATGDYNTPEGIMAGYNAAQMTADTFDKRMNKIRQSNWQNKVNQQARIDLIQQAKELWQGAQDDADKLNPVNIPFSGEGAQGGGGGTNIGGGQRGEPTREASYASYDRPGATGSPGYRWKDGGLATMFTRRR